jgi:hypothetical protein
MAVLMLTKGMKSLQLSMNELIPKLGRKRSTVDKSAYSKARRKFKHTAFIELNREAVVRTMYEDGNYETYKDLRILAADGSKVMLPSTDETIEAFGVVSYDNKRDTGEHCYALASVLYDVLNRVALDALLVPCNTYEVDLAARHLAHVKDNDLVTYDRGYCSYRMMALASQASGDFLIRCTARSFRKAVDMCAGNGPDDTIVELVAPKQFFKDPKNQGLPPTLTVRFVRATLDNGEYEVLATSLLDQGKYPATDFKKLYYMRWGIETFYGILKTRLVLENFSGYSPEAIRQDFFATIFLTGIETLMTMDAEETLGKQRGGYPKKVNKAVSFNAIKYRAFELFYSKEPPDDVLEQLTELFATSPTLIRKERNPPRLGRSSHTLLGFWKRKRKSVF